ncbi:DotD/TraH family lipoprotein [Enterobacter vonholyi]|uniref:DotD/TraH family lipoprotein n=1 Tax=Enterobacter vonholyi TaxID=2797505 RepID=UPI002DBAD5D1|nr:DotD/TraH family lipoprotein [Enterobacter vonholyi]MEB5981793.1 DotD/TraH family lipoprotein [Enterobacter vonholyi]
MSTLKTILTISACVSLLSGCALMGKKTEPASTTDEVINKNIELAISSIQKTQAELYQYGAINEKAVGITGGIYQDNVRIDMNWNGDAYELLAQMAKQRSFSFRSSGSRLPIPVSLKVTRAQYKDVMDSIQTQIGYRASIIVDNSSRTMTLNYNTPNLETSSTAKVIRTGTVSAAPYRPVSPVISSPTSASSTAAPSKGGNGLFNGGGSTIPLEHEAVRMGDKCPERGVLSRDKLGQAMSCSNGRWRKL